MDATRRAPVLVNLLYGPGTLLPAARALIALKQLATLGRILSTDPPEETIRQGDFTGRLRVSLESEREADEIRELLVTLPDVESATAHRESLPSPPSVAETTGARSVPQTVRVRTGHLDRLLELVGELIVHRSRLETRLAPRAAEELRGELDRVKGLVSDLFDTVMDLRLLPFETVAHRLVRSVRELARDLGKKVSFSIEGREVGLDRSLLEELVDPLQHLLRNALDHGLETPAERRAVGKEETGVLSLRLERRSDAVVLRLEDDGRGMDPELIRRTALSRGLLDRARLERLDESELLLLVTTPGFSTAERLTSVSGRGVGMDVVRTRIENLGGRLELRSRKGRGTTVRLTLPLTISVVEAFLVEAATRPYVVPVSSVKRTLELAPDEVQYREGRPHLVIDEHAVPLFDLGSLLRRGEERSPFAATRPLLLFRSGEREAAVSVDAIRSRRELVVKPLGPPLELLPEYSGATVLDDGRVALILDLANLVSPTRSVSAGR
jgi:two-component system chemotaxis sensor kinase CheA